MVDLLPAGTFPKLQLLVVLVGLAVVFRRGVPKAYGLSILMVVVFALDIISDIIGQGPTQPALGFVASRFFHGNGWWTPLTSVFIHAPAGALGSSFLSLHIIGNLFVLITAGPALEDRIGERRFLLVFFTAALGALVAHVALAYLTPIVSPDSLALGASGGIFGILTAFAVRYPKEKLPFILVFFILRLPAFLVLLIYLAFNLVFMLGGGSDVAWWGHFAGFLVGLPFAYMLPPAPAATPTQGTTRGLPDAEKLAPFATTPDLRGILDRIRQFAPDARTMHDASFADAWVDRFFEKATCPEGHAFRREGLTASCAGGETRVDFAR